jgi:hypothetical protein
MKSPPGDADDRCMFAMTSPMSAELWLSLAVSLGFAGFAACAAIAFALDTKSRVAELRVNARRMQLRAMRERARRLNR